MNQGADATRLDPDWERQKWERRNANNPHQKVQELLQKFKIPGLEFAGNRGISKGIAGPSAGTVAIFFMAPRNIRRGTFVYTSAAGGSGCSKSNRKPRGGSRGALTRSLSGPLVQEERWCLAGQPTRPCRACQHYLADRPCLYRLTRS
jgi:hypothetical protein